MMNSILLLALMFQFTHPGRGATVVLSEPTIAELVSIHAPREGCDLYWLDDAHTATGFNSRTPGGVRHVVIAWVVVGQAVSIHAPREGCDARLKADGAIRGKFQFTHPGRGATSRSPRRQIDR